MWISVCVRISYVNCHGVRTDWQSCIKYQQQSKGEIYFVVEYVECYPSSLK